MEGQNAKESLKVSVMLCLNLQLNSKECKQKEITIPAPCTALPCVPGG